MAKKQKFGIRFPFTAQDSENYYLDVNNTLKDKVRGLLMHVLFTPKGQRIRMPQFGTDLIRYIFEVNDTTAWNAIKQEITETISNFITNITINDIQILQSEDTLEEIYVRIDYSIQKGNKVETDSIYTQI